MARPGPAPRPPLAVVREGNPSHRPIREGVRLPPAQLAEPDWRQTFPNVSGRAHARQRGEMLRCRNIARQEWRRVVPILEKTAGVATVDATLLHDYCVCVARIDQGERALSREGMLQLGERGWQKNGWTTILGQYRVQMKAYIGELGLSPSSRGRLTPPKQDDDDDVFDS